MMRDFTGETFGNYKLVRPIGKGAFGEVYLGEYTFDNTRKVAVKIFNDNNAHFKYLFRREVKVLRNLKHNHIIPLISHGFLLKIWPTLIMEYAPKGNLEEHHPLGVIVPAETMLSYVKQITDALQYAHNQSILHRDIKPNNILLDEDNKIRLGDFGLARSIPQADETVSIAGTPRYMAPEQFRGHPCSASDQYAVALMVYQWLCGEYPFDGDGKQLHIQHAIGVVPPLKEKNHNIPDSVEKVVMRALAKDPQERFENIKQFYEALFTAYQEKDGVGETLSLAVEKKTYPRGEEISLYDNHQSRVRTVAWSPNGEYIASGGNDSVLHIWHAASGEFKKASRSTENLIFSVSWSPNNSQIALGLQDKSMLIYNIKRGTFKIYTKHHDSVRSVAWAPNGIYIASASDDKIVHIWEMAQIEKVTHSYKGHSGYVRAVAWSPDSKYIASASDDKTVHLWEAANPVKAIRIYTEHRSGVRAVAWSPDSMYIASGSLDTTVKIWGIDGNTMHTYQRHEGYVNTLAWSPDSKYVASGSDDQSVHIINAASGEQEFVYDKHEDAIRAVAWSPDGEHIVSATSSRTGENKDRTIRVWQASSH